MTCLGGLCYLLGPEQAVISPKMVCALLTLVLFGFLCYLHLSQRVLHEQREALSQATEELHRVSDENRQARQALERQVTLYRSILNAIPMGLYWKNNEGRLIGYNPEYAHIAGLKRMEEGLPFARTGASEWQQEGVPLDMEVMHKDIELLFLPKRHVQNGITRSYFVSKIAVKDSQGRVCGLLGSLLNQDLLNTETGHSFCGTLKMDCVGDLLPMPALTVDTQGRVQRCNIAFERRFGVKKGSLADQSSEYILPSDLSDAIQALLCSVTAAYLPDGKGLHLTLQSGCFRMMAQPIVQDGLFKGMVVLLSDIETFQRSEEYLESLVFDCRRSLKKTSGRLRQLNETISRLLQNPSLVSADTLRQIRYRIGACLETAACNNIFSSEALDFMDIKSNMISIPELLNSIRRDITERVNDKSIKVETAVESGCPEVIAGDRHKVYQALTLLVEQAVWRSPQGRIGVHVACSCRLNGTREMRFSVEHSGLSGLGGEQDKIIDPNVPLREWYRACTCRDQAVHLRIAARLLVRIGSRLYIETLSGVTRYSFDLCADAESGADEADLPEQQITAEQSLIRREDATMQDPNSPADHKHSPQSARILVVDDVEENRTLLEVILSKLGCTVESCAGGKAAIERCRQERYALILMDIQMPEVDGFEAIRRIRADGLNSGSPIIAMTASGQKDDELSALESGCDDYLDKPINRKLLEQKVRRHMAKIRQIQEAEQGLDITSFLEGDPDYYKTIETFVANLPGRIEEMRQALEKHDLKDLAFKAHALKGLGGFAGFAVYTEKAARMEASIREQNIDKIQAQIDEMVQLCVRTKIKSDKE